MNPSISHSYKDSAVDALPLDVTATDSTYFTDYNATARAIVVGTAGDLEVTTFNNNKVILVNIPVGILSLNVKIVHTANTTASDLTALF